ncbi:MAG: hypothetical protein AB1861_13910 [Cyanobacteriota bacterium]
MKAPEYHSARRKKRFFDGFLFCSIFCSDSDIDRQHSQGTSSIYTWATSSGERCVSQPTLTKKVSLN